MTAVLSHYLLGERVYNKLSAEIDGLDRNTFLWGANGPDIFFAHRVMPWQVQPSISKISHIMHNGYAEPLLNYLYEYAKVKDDSSAMGYAMGFITHYAFDSVAHPYIVNYADEKSKGESLKLPLISHAHEQIADGIKLSSVYHNKIEAYLDTLFLMREKHIPIHRFRLEDACPKDKDTLFKVAEILSSYLTDSGIYPEIKDYEIVRAELDWRNCLFLLNDRWSIKRNSMKGLEHLLRLPPIVSVFMRNVDIDLSEDPANLQHHPWKAPADGTIHYESFFELADIAEKKSLYLANKLLCGDFLTREDCFSGFSGH